MGGLRDRRKNPLLARNVNGMIGIRKKAMKMHKSEKIFLNEYADPNKTYIYQPEYFRLIGDGFRTWYRPDFYCVEDDEYIEVVLTNEQEEKYCLFRENFPKLKFKVVKLDKNRHNPPRLPLAGFTIFNVKEIPLSLYRRFKARCVKRGVTIKEGLIEAMILFLGEEEG